MYDQKIADIDEQISKLQKQKEQLEEDKETHRKELFGDITYVVTASHSNFKNFAVVGVFLSSDSAKAAERLYGGRYDFVHIKKLYLDRIYI